jgi:nucleoside-diphosphate-sugar epimerase
MNVLILGDVNFLGGKISLSLKERGVTTTLFGKPNHHNDVVSVCDTFINGDLLNDYAVNSLFKSNNPDVVIFLGDPAQNSSDINYNSYNDLSLVYKSINSLYKCISSFKIPHLYFRSSYDMYGATSKGTRAKLKESDICQPVSYKGVYYKAIEDFLRVHCFANNTKFTSARFFEVYGEENSETPAGILQSALKVLASGRAVAIKGPQRYIDFIHVDDAVKIFCKVFDEGMVGPVNIGSGKPIGLQTLFKRVGKELNRKDDIYLIDKDRLPFFSAIASTSKTNKFFRAEKNIYDYINILYSFYRECGK